MQTRELGVRSEDGVLPATFLMALSESAVDPNILRVTYDPAGLNAMEVNKDIISNGVNLTDEIKFKPTYEWYVSPNGSDLLGNGSANSPFRTIQKAVQEAESTNNNNVVNISAGTYTENINITKGYITLKGDVQSSETVKSTIIKGQIGINVTGVNDLFNNQIVITGCFISGTIIDLSASQHTLIVEGCRIETSSAFDTFAIDIQSTSADQRTYITNCRISQVNTAASTNALIQATVGRLLIENCQLSVRTMSSLVRAAGTATITQLSQCQLENDSSSDILQAMVEIASSSAAAHNIALNSFVVGSSVSKLQASAIAYARDTAGICISAVLNNFFSISGTTTASNVITRNGITNAILQVAGNRAATNTAAAIQSAINVIPASYVGESYPSGPTGPTGPDGAKGPTGDQGLQGVTGPDGAKGPTGDQGLQGVTGLQGPQGATGPDGAKGPTGDQGPQGVTGPDGAKGPTGDQGPQGVTGPDGAKGPTGDQGPQGVTGPDGAKGPTGDQGLQGVTGLQGPQGATGPDGTKGPTGDQGPIGVTGPDGAKGPTGDQGPIGVTGPDGAKGPTGDQGPQGVTGPDGAKGPTGDQGPIGVTGPDGAKGPTGDQGPQGVTGLQGPQGATGPNGASGALAIPSTTALTQTGLTASPVGTTINNTPTLIASQRVVLTSSGWYYTSKTFGLLGNLTFTIAGNHNLAWTASIAKNDGAPVPITGYTYLSTADLITVPVNLISYNSTTGYITFSPGDYIDIFFYATNIGGGNPQITQSVELVQGVYGAVTNLNESLPPSGTITQDSLTAGPQPLEPTNSYRIENIASADATLSTYDTSLIRTVQTTNLAPGDVFPALADPALTGLTYYDLTSGSTPPPPQPFPSSPVLVTESNEIPIGIDPSVQYQFDNGGSSTMTITLFIDGQPPGPTLAPTLPGQSVVSPSPGYTGFTAAFA
jgi:hypothetical protein